MRTLKLTLAYDGTGYAGWQIQKRSHQPSAISYREPRKPTIQGELERVLGRVLQERVKVIGSGRTDAGVHALAQVAHLRTRASMSCERLQRALNSLLPPDIVVTKIEGAPPGFHARFDAKAKRYRYQLVRGPFVSPFERRSVHHVRHPLDVALMRREAKALLGRHDVRAFHKAGRPTRDAVRTISAIEVRARGRLVTIEIEANGFLYAMVRRIVGTLLDIGRGHRPPGTIRKILRFKDPRLTGPTAPARGLCLVSVRYP